MEILKSIKMKFFYTLIILLQGCNLFLQPNCKIKEMRCHQNAAQICGSDQQWQVYLDCNDLVKISNMNVFFKCEIEDNDAICIERIKP